MEWFANFRMFELSQYDGSYVDYSRALSTLTKGKFRTLPLLLVLNIVAVNLSLIS